MYLVEINNVILRIFMLLVIGWYLITYWNDIFPK